MIIRACLGTCFDHSLTTYFLKDVPMGGWRRYYKIARERELLGIPMPHKDNSENYFGKARRSVENGSIKEDTPSGSQTETV